MKQIIISALLVALTILAVAQDGKNEVSIIVGTTQMDMNPGENGLAVNLQYSRQLHPWFGVEGRLGVVQYNNFPAFSNYTESDQNWGISQEFDAYIRSLPASQTLFKSWGSSAFYGADASVYLSPLHTPHHRIKLYAGATRQYRSVNQTIFSSMTISFDNPDFIKDYEIDYSRVNISEWGKHYGISYQYLLNSGWSVGATARVTYMDTRVSIGHSDHALFGLSVGRAF